MAEAFAAKCAAMLGTGTSQNSAFDSIGRNFYLLSNPDSDPENRVDYSVAITSWFNELFDCDCDNDYFGTSCANYTQVCLICIMKQD